MHACIMYVAILHASSRGVAERYTDAVFTHGMMHNHKAHQADNRSHEIHLTIKSYTNPWCRTYVRTNNQAVITTSFTAVPIHLHYHNSSQSSKVR